MSKDEMLKKQIISKKNKLHKIEKSIAELEKQLADTANSDKAIGITIKTMNGENFSHYIHVTGKVDAVDYAVISPETGGQIKTIHVKEGQWVRKGQVLVSLNTDVTVNSIREVKTNLELANKLYEKQKKLWEQNIGSEIEYLQAKTNKESAEARLNTLQAQLDMSRLSAPFDGYVDRIFAKEGELAMAGASRILEIVNLDKIEIKADIPETYVGAIKKGEKVNITFEALPNDTIEASISWISKVIDKQNRTFQIKLMLTNKNEKIKPNMVSTIKINDFNANSAFVIPSIILKQDIKGFYIYKVDTLNKDSIATKIYIAPGLSYKDETMVETGIKQGDKIIIDGHSIVSTGAKVKVK
jgi:RND family efflux transporter MFP subunit